MKRIFGIASMMVMLATNMHAQDNNTYVNNDDTYYNTDNNVNYNSNGGDQNNYDVADNNPDNTPAPTDQTFHEQLSPYGNWVDYPGYGQVWVPTQVDANFSPYSTNGHWVYTNYGWTWVSDYAWGSATFHYGRWFRDESYGWMWVPGYEWASAWVAWGDYDGYYCWAPLTPDYTFSFYTNYRPPFYCWNFIPHAYIGCERPGAYMIDRDRVFHGGAVHIHIINEGGTCRNTHFFAGPKAEMVEHVTGQHINRVNISSVHNVTVAHTNNINQVHQFNSNASRTQFNNYNMQQQHSAPNQNVLHQSEPVQRSYNNAQPTQQHFAQNQYMQHQNEPVQRNYNQAQSVQQRFEQHQNMPVQQNYNHGQPVQQHFAQNQNFQHQSMPVQRNFTAAQPVQRNIERSFASVQHSAPNYSAGGGNHAGSFSGGHNRR